MDRRASNQLQGADLGIPLYVESCDSHLSSFFKRRLDESIHDLKVEVKIELLSKLVDTMPILVACDTTQKASELIANYQLTELKVYWLIKEEVNEKFIFQQSHHCLDWRHYECLTGFASILIELHRMREQNRQTEEKLDVLSQHVGDLSITLSKDGRILDCNENLANFLNRPKETLKHSLWFDCLSIPSSSARVLMEDTIEDISRTQAITRLPAFPIRLGTEVVMLDGIGGPSLNGQISFTFRRLAKWQQEYQRKGASAFASPVSLLLINPDQFADINNEFGRSFGDTVLKEIMSRVTGLLRTADFTCRYSGAIFAAHLPDTNQEQSLILASRLASTLNEKRYTSKHLTLSFSIGVSTLEVEEQPGELTPLELFRRANTALQAARSVGGNEIVHWQPRLDENLVANLDRMSGKFSESQNDDFRLMTLQWEIIQVIGETHSMSQFASKICNLLQSSLGIAYVGMVSEHQKISSLLAVSSSLSEKDVQSINSWGLTKLGGAAVNSSFKQVSLTVADLNHAEMPLKTRGVNLGVLLLCWFTNEDVLVDRYLNRLEQILPSLAAAMERMRLLEQEHKRTEFSIAADEDAHELIYVSPQMQSLVQQVKQVGPTDATVLLIGESGTGKEVIARKLHENSLYSNKPFVTVDCSTIVKHLIESELFGHRKGAFTGAIADQPGTIAQADGGTLFLDEIGELPLDIQAKLLRFVQEKTYVAVGDQRVKKVDVRLILATNRNLTVEVEQGRFRADLFYRINVFTLNLLPLKERKGDAIQLAQHFLNKFVKQYKKNILGFTESCSAQIANYSWPGNIRELRNTLMRAVIMCEQEWIDIEHLQLNETGHFNKDVEAVDLPYSNNNHESGDRIQVYQRLAELLEPVIKMASNDSAIPSVYCWLEQLWLEQCLCKWTSMYRIAKELKVSESTLRRKYAKLKSESTEFASFEPYTQDCSALLKELIETQESAGLWEQIEKLVYSKVIATELPQSIKAALLNVTQPTLRKLIKSIG